MPKMQEHFSAKSKSPKKRRPDYPSCLALLALVPSGVFVGGRQNGLPALYALWVIYRRAASMPRPLCPWVLRAIPDKYSGARRGKREKSVLLRNISYK